MIGGPMEARSGEKTELRSLLRALWRRKWLFAVIAITIPAAVYAISTQVAETYRANALIRVQSTAAPTTLGQPAATIDDIDTLIALIGTDKVANEAASEFGRPVSSVNASVEATPITGTSGSAIGLLSIVASADSADGAAGVANAYARAIDTLRTKQSIQDIDRSITQVRDQLAQSPDTATRLELERQLQELQSARAAQGSTTELVQPAKAPPFATSPRPRRNAALAAVVAVLLGLGAVAFAERLDRRLRDPSDLEPLLGAPLLSVIPKAAFPGERPARTPVAEAFRTLAASLLYFNVDRRVNTVMVASPTKGDGKTTVATHLAIALARDGQNVILVDCDLRRPQVAVRLGIEPAAGVAMVLTNQAQLAESMTEVDVGDGRLRVLAGGTPPPNPARLLSSARMDSVLGELAEQADIVVLDTPPLLNVSDAVPLLERVSGSIVVARIGYTGREAVRRLRQVIETAGGTLLGGVATGAHTAGLYGYGSDYYDDVSVGRVEEPSVNGANAPQPARPRAD
jgi:capsular exopolysaccharide synthesis family protein